MEKIEGVIITEQDYGETSKILNIITREYGIIGVIAKGCRSLKSDLRSVTSKLVYGYFYLNYKKDKLSVLNSVDIIDNFKNIKRDIMKISYASFLLDLTNQVYKQNNDKRIFCLFLASLMKIDQGFDAGIITNILELKYLEYLGIMPVIDSCAICGNTTSIATLSSDVGGYVCNKCYTTQTLVNDKTIKLIRMFYYVDIEKISQLDISNSVKFEINDFLNKYYDKYTGLYLKSKKFLETMQKEV